MKKDFGLKLADFIFKYNAVTLVFVLLAVFACYGIDAATGGEMHEECVNVAKIVGIAAFVPDVTMSSAWLFYVAFFDDTLKD